MSLCLLVTVWSGSATPADTPKLIVVAAAGVLLLAAFVAVEFKAPEPIFPLRLFRNSIFTVANSAALVIGACRLTVTIYIPVFIHRCPFGTPEIEGRTDLPPLPAPDSRRSVAPSIAFQHRLDPVPQSCRIRTADRIVANRSKRLRSRVDSLIPRSACPFLNVEDCAHELLFVSDGTVETWMRRNPSEASIDRL